VKKLIITAFVIFGVAVGFVSVWFRQNTDTAFLLNIPGTILGDAVYNWSINLIGNPHSSQAHYTIPWLLRIPQVYVPTSIFFWGIIGTLLTIFLKPKVIGIIMGAYLLTLGIIILSL
jgi:hypothetical protein